MSSKRYGPASGAGVGPTLPPPNPSGICMCGQCGRPTSIAQTTDTNKGYVKGEPVRYVRGHGARGLHREKKRPGGIQYLIPYAQLSMPALDLLSLHFDPDLGQGSRIRALSAKYPGEVALMVGILVDAFRVANIFGRRVGGVYVHSRQREALVELLEWVRSEEDTYVFSLAGICSTLGLDMDAIRKTFSEALLGVTQGDGAIVPARVHLPGVPVRLPARSSTGWLCLGKRPQKTKGGRID